MTSPRNMIQVAPFQFVNGAFFKGEAPQVEEGTLLDPNHIELHRQARLIREYNLKHQVDLEGPGWFPGEEVDNG